MALVRVQMKPNLVSLFADRCKEDEKQLINERKYAAFSMLLKLIESTDIDLSKEKLPTGEDVFVYENAGQKWIIPRELWEPKELTMSLFDAE